MKSPKIKAKIKIGNLFFWKGKININDRAEIKSANFFDKDTLNDLPENEKSLIESLKYYRENNVIMLK